MREVISRPFVLELIRNHPGITHDEVLDVSMRKRRLPDGYHREFGVWVSYCLRDLRSQGKITQTGIYVSERTWRQMGVYAAAEKPIEKTNIDTHCDESIEPPRVARVNAANPMALWGRRA